MLYSKIIFFVKMCLWNEMDVIFEKIQKDEKMNVDVVHFYIVHQIG